MIEGLWIGHVFELSPTEAIAGFLTTLAIFAAFFVVQFILPGRRVTAYVVDNDSRRYGGHPWDYPCGLGRRNGLGRCFHGNRTNTVILEKAEIL